jgi:glucosamine--fructose-6-phosphate aminotransferase (isomerizing)
MNLEIRMMRDIRDQPASLARVIDYQHGEGRKNFQRAAEILADAPRVIVTGMGASLYAAMPFAVHVGAQTFDSSELLYFGLEAARDALVVVVSRSGESVEIVRLLPKLRELQAKIIGVTNEPESTLAREADLPIIVNSGRDELVAVQSYTGTTTALLLLAAAVRETDHEGAHAISAVQQEIDHGVGHPERWTSFCRDAGVIYVLGRGPSYASACEGALLFHETARLPAVPMTAGGFRHGPVEVVDERFRAIIFASQSDTRELDLALADRLRRMGGRVEVISADSGAFAPVVEIVPVQFAAFHAALACGVEPGRFRHATLVTASETDFGHER